MTKNKKILVAMSGGVDSSAVASKLLNEGYFVEGITLNFGKFCSEKAIFDAKKVADQLGIKHFVINCEENFEEKVVKYFADEYIEGKTPNPCTKCNREIKFYELLKFREKINADFLATGHYAKIINKNNIYYLEKAEDLKKDQSYFLSQLKYEYLQYIIFPLENITKTEVREYAKKLDLFVAEKKDSQDVCFTNGKNYKEIIKNYHNSKNGDIFHIDGRKIGEHNGIINYTQGQRKGLGIGGYSNPLFVIKIDAKNNIVYVGEEKDLFKNDFYIDKVNILKQDLKFENEYEFDVKLRSTNNSNRAKVIFYNDQTANVKLLKPSRNISIGQVCCFYDGNIVVASGYIKNLYSY